MLLEKFLGFVLTTICAVVLGAAFLMPLSDQSFTGPKAGPASVNTNQTVAVQANGSYDLTATSCYPFELSTDGHALTAQPQDPKGTECGHSFYKVDQTGAWNALQVKSGSPEITLSADSSVGMTVSYNQSFAQPITNAVLSVLFILWFACILVIALA